MPSLIQLLLTWVVVKGIDMLLDKNGPSGRPPHVPPPRVPANSRRATTPSAYRPVAVPATTSAPPWPQVTPSGLPPFPGAGWEPDEPPPPDVVSRAQALLSVLWQTGPGTFKVEKTAGRWIVYRATAMGEKKGVVAFRQSQHAPFLATPGTPTEAPTAPASATVPAAYTRPVAAPPAAVPASSSSPHALPYLRRGMGSRSAPNPDVLLVQQRLGIQADGIFGGGTEAAVRAFQSKNGLKSDGVVGPDTWGALLGKAA